MANFIFSNVSSSAQRRTEALLRYRIGHFLGAARNVAIALLPVVFALLAFAPTRSEASNVQFVGTVLYSVNGNVAVLTADEVANFDAVGFSGTLRLELWALPAPWTNAGEGGGYKLAQYTLGQLTAGYQYSHISSGFVPFTPPPNGTWTYTMFVTEYVGVPFNDGYGIRDYINFPTPVVIGPPPPPPPALTPQVGLWWNPDESGSGYALDYKHGVIIVTVYSYGPTGAPQWYIASGPLLGSTFTSRLDKFVGGQCISCTYFGQPTAVGNDGMITIVFSSPTSATAYLPGNRVTQIQPMAF